MYYKVTFENDPNDDRAYWVDDDGKEYRENPDDVAEQYADFVREQEFEAKLAITNVDEFGFPNDVTWNSMFF